VCNCKYSKIGQDIGVHLAYTSCFQVNCKNWWQ